MGIETVNFIKPFIATLVELPRAVWELKLDAWSLKVKATKVELPRAVWELKRDIQYRLIA